MSVTLRVQGKPVTIRDQEAVVNDAKIKKFIEDLRDEFPSSGADPYPDLSLAHLVIEKMGGEILGFDPPQFTPGRIY